ncbi:MAG: hypothetical protein HQ483_06175 [Rhodospirillales bacterium]|nr:hypothetical protein [Rhodospirillales bacterium]
MAKAATQNTAKAPSFTLILWGAGIVTVWGIISPSSMLILSLGMLPTLVAYFCDRTEQKFALYCVGGMNFCGVFPFLLKLTDDHSFTAAMEIMSNVFSLAIIFTAAGFGWLMFLSIPPVVSSFLTVLAEARVKSLKSIQKKIVDEWGASIAKGNSETAAKVPLTDEETD